MGFKFISACYVVATYVAVKLFLRHRRRSQYPPGPPGIPFLGNIFQLEDDLWVPFTSWKERYGPVFHLNVAGQSLIILNSNEAATELLDRRAKNYSDRPENIVASNMMAGGLVMVLSNGNVWRRMRRAAHEELSGANLRRFHPVQTAEAVILTDDLISNPEKWDMHLRRAAQSVIVSMLYGLPAAKSLEDDSLRRIEEFTSRFIRAVLPGSYLVELFPWMRHLPTWLAKWKRNALDAHQKDTLMFEGFLNDVQKRVAEGDERPSFSLSLVKSTEKYGLNIKESSWLTATMYAAGADGIIAITSWFFVAMAAYPEVQKRAQAELDAVVGRSRMPTFADLPKLPYIGALLKELLRWRPTGRIGLPHVTLEDDWYNGYLIPAGSTCIANVWALHHDPKVYGDDTERFNPERFLTEEGHLRESFPNTNEGHAVYGFGKRICIGKHVANNALFMNFANILWATDVSPLDGKRPDTEGTVNTGFVVYPTPSQYKFTPRFPDVPSIVAQTRNSVSPLA